MHIQYIPYKYQYLYLRLLYILAIGIAPVQIEDGTIYMVKKVTWKPSLR